MTVLPGSFFHPKTLERLASELLIAYQRRTERPVQAPLSAEHIAEVCSNLSILWDPISEKPSTTVLAGLAPQERLIVLNERRRRLFDDDPGLYNTVIGHELAHWRLHVDRALLDHPTLPGLDHAFAFVCTMATDSWDERNAHRFMACLLLPSDLLREALTGADLQHWRTLYRLREQFDVTISVLRIRLEGLGLTYVDEEGRLHRSRQEAQGQRRLL